MSKIQCQDGLLGPSAEKERGWAAESGPQIMLNSTESVGGWALKMSHKNKKTKFVFFFFIWHLVQTPLKVVFLHYVLRLGKMYIQLPVP